MMTKILPNSELSFQLFNSRNRVNSSTRMAALISEPAQ